MKLLECVPNISEGRKPEVIKTIAKAIEEVDGVKLLHIDSGFAANRTVFTFVGRPEDVMEAAFRMYLKAHELIDMSQHQGTHPRQGAVDVCPFIPLAGMTTNEVLDMVLRLTSRLEATIDIPGYYYEYSAVLPERMNLANLRKGEYESLPQKFQLLKPDFGSVTNWQRFGATVIGVRKLLIAYNVNLNTSDASIARKIASRIRESGYIDKNGLRQGGKLESVKAIGWYIEDFKCAQVSFNLTDLTKAGMLDVYLATLEEAKKEGVEVKGSELIGLAPLSEFIKAADYFKPEFSTPDEAIQISIKGLGLDALKPFKAEQKIIEKLISEINS